MSCEVAINLHTNWSDCIGLTLLSVAEPAKQKINGITVVLHPSFVCPAGCRGHSGALVSGFYLRCVPAVPWMYRDFKFPLKCHTLITKGKIISLYIYTSSFCHCLDSIFNTLTCQILNLKTKTGLCS